MSARLKLKHMKRHVAMIEADNNRLHYELSSLSQRFELIGAREKLEPMALLSETQERYLRYVASHLARTLVAKLCANLDECIAKRLSDYTCLHGDIVDVRFVAPKFAETLVEVTVR